MAIQTLTGFTTTPVTVLGSNTLYIAYDAELVTSSTAITTTIGTRNSVTINGTVFSDSQGINFLDSQQILPSSIQIGVNGVLQTRLDAIVFENGLFASVDGTIQTGSFAFSSETTNSTANLILRLGATSNLTTFGLLEETGANKLNVDMSLAGTATLARVTRGDFGIGEISISGSIIASGGSGFTSFDTLDVGVSGNLSTRGTTFSSDTLELLNSGEIASLESDLIIAENSAEVTNIGTMVADNDFAVLGASASSLVVVNGGQIVAGGDFADGIVSGLFNLTNNGTITTQGAIVTADTVDIVNTGQIAGAGTAILMNATTGQSSLVNSGAMSTSAELVRLSNGVEVLNTGTMSADMIIRQDVASASTRFVNDGQVTATGTAFVVSGLLDLTNTGSIDASTLLFVSLLVSGNASVAIANSGDITSDFGMTASASALRFINDGSYIVLSGNGITSGDNSDIRNLDTMSARFDAMRFSGDFTLVNTGEISAGLDGVEQFGTPNGISRVSNTGEIVGGDGGLRLTGEAVVNNAGTISATSDAIVQTGSASLKVVNTGDIIGGSGVTTAGDDAVIINHGNISATGGNGVGAADRATVNVSGTVTASDYAIDVGNQAHVTNSGTLVGAMAGVRLQASTQARLINSGTILSDDTGILFSGAGEIKIVNTGTIAANNNGIWNGVIGSNVSLVNAGDIQSNVNGVSLNGAGEFLINSSGSIIGASIGVKSAGLLGTSLIINRGLIQGEGLAISLSFESTVDFAIERVGVVNHGEIVGSVNLTRGSDVYDGRLGQLNGALLGGDGDDILYTGNNDDTVFGGDGNDDIRGAGGRDTLYGDTGDDFLNGQEGNDLLIGGDGNDELRGGTENDSLFGDGGNDVLDGGEGDDRLEGGDGNDRMLGGKGEDVLFGQAGDDSIRGNFGDDELLGGSGNDTLQGDQGDDILNGGFGNDRIDGGAGIDVAQYTGNFADYDIRFISGDRVRVIDERASGNTGIDTLTTVEFLQFQDQIINLAELEAELI